MHGDVKSSNAVVYTNNIGTAENWTAKLIDFGHSVIRVKDSTLNPKRNQMLGTDLYRPPELAKPGSSFDGAIAERVDIWCWGMLFWELVLDGYLPFTNEAMQHLRVSGEVATTAHDQCKSYMETHHRDERGMFSSVLYILGEALKEDPLLRPAAATLVQQVRTLAQQQYVFLLPKSCQSACEHLMGNTLHKSGHDSRGLE